MSDDRAFARAVESWFAEHRRDLPWRVEVKGSRSPYYALVSEVMLQQTQAARVAERFARFIERFPTFEALAAAREDEVLAEWTGLGYYRRARNLHAAAKAVVGAHGGQAPREVDALRGLPGVGRYTAGAIASVCFEERAPIVDANVARVLLRVHGKKLAIADPKAQKFAWERAESLVNAAASPGAFNEGLMELGALVCSPRNPRCENCPLRAQCAAFERGTQDRIPARAAKAEKPVVHHTAVIVRTTDADGEVFHVEQRAAKGLWAGLWQAPTLESNQEASPAEARAFLARRLGVAQRAIRARDLTRTESFTRVTSSRTVRFAVYEFGGAAAPGASLRPASRESLLAGDPPLAVPHRRILLGEHP
ncbi:MAG: A/G-specific adenine glycosylase [Phycisphaerales bacterium]